MDRHSRDFTPSMNLRGIQSAFFWAGILVITAAFVACSPTVQVDAPQATAQLISPSGYMDLFGDDPAHVLIDVRTPEEFASGHINGAINIAVEELPARLTEVPGDQPIVVYCRSGNRSSSAARILIEARFSPVYDLGGIQDWTEQGLPIE